MILNSFKLGDSFIEYLSLSYSASIQHINMFLKIQSYRVLTVSFLVPIGVVAGIFLIRRLREKQWGWVTNNSSLKDRIFVITGANTGLGYETVSINITLFSYYKN